ncbi:P2Y purinoceptor 1-like [Salminus brasiliensis]|uniref:P2Y purinoceptor 1-like n=1 Tax=Salminus brasiliensis TaxID=930266 RepID=UPI003B837583
MIPLLINNSYKHEHHIGVVLDFSNRTSPFCSQYRDNPWYCSILLVLFIIGLPIGVLGNMVAILNYTCCRRPWTTGTVFLLNLALCDFTWLLLLPFTLYFTLQRPHLATFQIFCQFKKTFFNINVYGSIFFLALISFDRYAGTVHPISSLRWWNSRKACLCCVVTWLLLLLGSIPDFFMTFALSRPDNSTFCMDHLYGPFNYMTAILLVRMLVGFLLPLGVMGALYSRMMRVLKSMSGRPERKSIRGQGGTARRAAKPLLLITAALVVFVVSYMPYHVMIVTLVFMRFTGKLTYENVNTLYTASEFFEAMCSMSSCLDPLLYILASERFLRSWRRLRSSTGRLFCRASRRVGVQDPA